MGTGYANATKQSQRELIWQGLAPAVKQGDFVLIVPASGKNASIAQRHELNTVYQHCPTRYIIAVNGSSQTLSHFTRHLSRSEQRTIVRCHGWVGDVCYELYDADITISAAHLDLMADCVSDKDFGVQDEVERFLSSMVMPKGRFAVTGAISRKLNFYGEGRDERVLFRHVKRVCKGLNLQVKKIDSQRYRSVSSGKLGAHMLWMIFEIKPKKHKVKP